MTLFVSYEGIIYIISRQNVMMTVYKFKKITGRTDFSDQFRKIMIRHKRIGYDKNVMRQSACLVIIHSRLLHS